MKPNEPIGRYFTWSEAIATSHRGIDNTPDDETASNIMQTALKMDRVRDYLGQPIHVNSWYRSPALNKAVGGAKTSAHMLGYAVDFICPRAGDVEHVVQVLERSGIEFDQLIQENAQSASGGWVHISFDPMMRKQVLLFDGHTYQIA